MPRYFIFQGEEVEKEQGREGQKAKAQNFDDIGCK
jgi:hypothetical protein